MLKVGLTGGVSCGKSTVGEMFVAKGAHLIKADDLGHQLMQPGQSVYHAIVAAFGEGILNTDRTISRPKLADAAFPTGRIAELNAIVHPAVIAAQEAWMDEFLRTDPSGVAIVEAALLLESGSWRRFDRLITVVCSFEQKVERFAKRHSLSLQAARGEVERRQKVQATDDEKVKISHYVIDNAGSLVSTREQVERIWQELKDLARVPVVPNPTQK
ncbi:MAG TPA: dephospho-CoA kinase [Terriglobales bacterium]|nr:dephospho-CoA kinase [Terriglobales bacterium]